MHTCCQVHRQEDIRQSSLRDAAVPERQDMQLVQPAPSRAANSQSIASKCQNVQDDGESPDGAENRSLTNEQSSTKIAQKQKPGACEPLQSGSQEVKQQPDGRSGLQHLEIQSSTAAEDAERDVSSKKAVRHALPAEAALCNGGQDLPVGATQALQNGFSRVLQNGFGSPVAFLTLHCCVYS